jgi:hypothetical protein
MLLLLTDDMLVSKRGTIYALAALQLGSMCSSPHTFGGGCPMVRTRVCSLTSAVSSGSSVLVMRQWAACKHGCILRGVKQLCQCRNSSCSG